MAKAKKRSDGLYQKQITIGRNADGSYKRKTVYGKTQKELDAKISELLHQISIGIRIDDDSTFSEVADIWIKNYRVVNNTAWAQTQERITRQHLIPYLGNIKVKQLTKFDLQSLMNIMRDNGLSTSKFPLNSNELSYPVVYILSRYAESVIENNIADMEEFSPHLVAASEYFDAAVGANDRAEYDVDFLLSGAASYFLSDDFGSAKVLCSEYFARINPETNVPQKIMGNLLGYLLLNRDFHISEDTPDGEKVCRSLLAYYNTGEGAEEIQNLLSEYRKVIYENDAPMEIYYVDILCAIVTVALSKSSWSLLPRYSELDQSLWSDYLKSPKAPKMLWPAQQLIGEKGVLRGQSAIVQLPTGVGKTKSIELIIRSSFASGRATTAIIVAPLRALCNEIANDMISAFGDEVLVNQFSDVLEEDFSLDLFLSLKSKILICTPEKLSYIIHHQADFLDEIGLYIFDEGHMFDDGSRGAIYELLISEIRSHISLEEQLILLSAVLSNAEQIQKWLLGEAGVLASDPQIKATPKTIGFASQTKDIHYYSNDSAQEDFYVPRSIEAIALQKRPREKKQRYFPELTDAKDIAIYYANKLCKNGGAAIFANRTSTVLTVINRIIELRDRGHDLAEIKGNSDGEEMNRLAQLMSGYYGEQHPYTIACHLGVVPHYSNLPNGLRLAVEYAFRNKAVRLVVCTSTLAQGVNIPIKYLFNNIVGVIQSHKDNILDILSAYPTYFSERVQWICKD